MAKIDLSKELKDLYQPTAREVVQVEVSMTKKSAWGVACVLTYKTLKKGARRIWYVIRQKAQGFFAPTLPFYHT